MWERSLNHLWLIIFPVCCMLLLSVQQLLIMHFPISFTTPVKLLQLTLTLTSCRIVLIKRHTHIHTHAHKHTFKSFIQFWFKVRSRSQLDSKENTDLALSSFTFKLVKHNNNRPFRSWEGPCDVHLSQCVNTASDWYVTPASSSLFSNAL